MTAGCRPGTTTSKTNIVDSSHPESDIEACTRVGDIIYWITSHGRSKKGKWRNSRYRLFATEIFKKDGNI